MSGVRLLDYWSPPDGAGQPVACLATTFTFESDFFTQDCLARFLSLSTSTSEGDKISSIAAILEEEDRLSEAQVSVLVDWSAPAEKRNLRWDLLPVSVPGGLLHAKVTVLLWERSARIILGSANLTSAGYRRQIELALAIDLDERCRVPRPVIDELAAELRHYVDLIPGRAGGPKGRALATVDRLAARVENLDLPMTSRSELRLALATARPGISPIDRLDDVWRGVQPLRATMLSPFWDDAVPAPAVEAVRRRLTGRPASHRWITFAVGVDPYTGSVKAPQSLAAQSGTDVATFDPQDSELRALHAKLLLVESDDWLAALIGSSNATAAGLGLHPHHGHHELNLWLGCPGRSKTAKHLRKLAQIGDEIDLDDDAQWEPSADEDEPTTPVLPVGFARCAIAARPPLRVVLEFDAESLPTSWAVRTPAGQELLTADQWRADGLPQSKTVDLSDEALPSYLYVRWDINGEFLEATWIVNVEDRAALPPPAELAELPVDALLAALASTRPLPVALEHELRRRQSVDDAPRRDILDPLRRFDDSGLLLQRARHLSLALWRLQERLSRPTTSIDALHWRLQGALGPLAIADGLVQAALEGEALPGEAHFLLAELALTVSSVDWPRVANGISAERVRRLVSQVLSSIEDRRNTLPPATDTALDCYVRDALKKARS
ncbi:hypothetical protein [Mycolicibacterium austroafricanum]|uniref:hypothetical protein n=1 Tax=Mycolicibacterium austroafricanum TaxID=39687 RepID=UPI001CA35AE7|nr:hypothetical protein [Mycolicibacterium austroafricanum]QZT60289.1 hypothetical protein JN085_14525 [Mycolicibacterium austroafricanum]